MATTKEVNAYTQYANYCREQNVIPLSWVKWKHKQVDKTCSHCGISLWACGCGGHCFPSLTNEELKEVTN